MWTPVMMMKPRTVQTMAPVRTSFASLMAKNLVAIWGRPLGAQEVMITKGMTPRSRPALPLNPKFTISRPVAVTPAEFTKGSISRRRRRPSARPPTSLALRVATARMMPPTTMMPPWSTSILAAALYPPTTRFTVASTAMTITAPI